LGSESNFAGTENSSDTRLPSTRPRLATHPLQQQGAGPNRVNTAVQAAAIAGAFFGPIGIAVDGIVE